MALALGSAATATVRNASGSGGSKAHSTSGSGSSSSSAGAVHVKGYTRKDGTYVAPHDRAYRGAGRSHLSGGFGVDRDAHGRIKRSEAAKDDFKHLHPCPVTGKSRGPCPGWIIDHVRPLCAGGPDDPSNMQWQTSEDAHEKDKGERVECNAFRR